MIAIVPWFRVRSTGWLMLVLISGGVSAVAQGQRPPLPGTPKPPSGELSRSPFQGFRELLASSPTEREEFLRSKSEVHRKHLEARLKEFDPLPASERELRIKMMELRWFLVPLIALPPSNRVERLSRVPDDIRPLVEDRLQKWDALPQDLRQEAVQFGTAMQYIARPETGGPEEQVKFWNAAATQSRNPGEKPLPPLPPAPDKRKRAVEHLERFMELSLEEKQRALKSVPESDRLAVGNTLKKLESISPEQRRVYLESLQKFNELDEESRRAFLRNAERWRNLPSEERRALRELVAKLPPLPPGFDGPPMPPLPGKLTATQP